MYRFAKAAAALAVIMAPVICQAQGGAGGSTPAITNVLDGGGYTANIAEGSIFVVFGKNLCGEGLVYGTLPYSSAPLNGVKVSFTPVAGGAATDAYMVYTYARGATSQLAGILPSTVPPGSYNVTVSNNGTVSAAFKTTVVANKFGIISVNGSGAGRAVVQNYISPTQYDLDRFTTGTLAGYTYSPAHPGQIIVIWGTGIGPIRGPDNMPPGAIDLRGSLDVQVIIDGVAITPDLYAGRAPTFPGADEIILTLPAGVTTGCQVSLQVSVNGQLSNPTTISIAGGSDSACIVPGFTTDQLARFDQGGSFNVGVLSLAGGFESNASTTIRVDTASAIFVSLDPDQLQAGTARAPAAKAPLNSCVVVRRTITGPNAAPQNPSFKLLGAGNVVLNGPNTMNVPLSIATLLNAKVKGVTVVNGGVLAAGTYTVTGPGGKDVGPFQASIALSQPLVVTSAVPNPIPRDKDFTISWTGGGTEQVTIEGGSSVPGPGNAPGHPVADSTQFTCVTTGDKGSFTVPASILQQLLAAKGSVTVSSNYKMTTFTAPLVAGGNLDYGFFYTGFDSRFSTAFQ